MFMFIKKGSIASTKRKNVNTSTVINVNIINVHTHTQMVWYGVRGVACVVCGVVCVCMWCGVCRQGSSSKNYLEEIKDGHLFLPS